LGGGYYLHNISLPIFRNSKNPENNIRDAFIGYFLVFLSYSVCGVMGYYGFSTFPMAIQQNCLNMFGLNDKVAIFIRACTFCQLLAATALIFACQRAQILLLFTGSQETKSSITNFSVNFSILIGPVIIALLYPHVGKLAGLMGAFGGLFTIYILPTLTYLKQS
jgi:hypothetical protein